MNSKSLRTKALSLCLIVATIATYSMVALAGSEKVAGELLVNGNNVNGVTVNGDVAQSGRSVFTTSRIITQADASASLNFGKTGSLSIAPNTEFVVSVTENGISGELLSGAVSVLNAENSVIIKTATGETINAAAGETVNANAARKQDDDGNGGGGAWFIWALVLGGAAAGIIMAATSNNNDLNLGGGVTVVSPNR